MQHALASLKQWYQEGLQFSGSRQDLLKNPVVHPFMDLWANLHRYEPAPFTKEEAYAEFLRGVNSRSR
jgi:hypothetical protein